MESAQKKLANHINILFATHNKNKVIEIKSLLPQQFYLESLNDIQYTQPIPEPFDSFTQNAKHKINTLLQNNITHEMIFSEDSGLIVNHLYPHPGVYSARYAGENATPKDNIHKLLKNLLGVNERQAYFITIISLYYKKHFYFFEGRCEGIILNAPIGNNGFGYDPIFKPNDSPLSFGQMDLTQKNIYSHRKKALQKMLHFLQTHND